MRRLLPLAALLALPAQAQQINPPLDLWCGIKTTGARIVKLRLVLLEGTTVRKYRDFDLATLKIGPNTVTFAKNTVATTINGMRLAPCDFKIPDMTIELPAGQRWDTRVYTLPAGAVPTVVFEVVGHADGSPGGYIVIRGKAP